MNSARNQLILLGLVCQGLSSDSYALPVVYAILWAAGLGLAPKPIIVATWFEGVLLVSGCLIGYHMAQWLGESVHFFIGHGLALLQLARLLRPLKRREKIFSLTIALFHLGVGATFVFDFRFLIVFAAAAALLPGTLMELESESFSTVPDRAVNRPGWKLCFAVAAVAVLFFLTFPRGIFGTALALSRPGPSEQGTMIESVMNPSRSGVAQSSQVLLQIEGENIGYLRCFALVSIEGDGTTWSPGFREPLRELEPPGDSSNLQRRRVRVKNVSFLGRTLPTDGEVARVEGKFFRRPMKNHIGAVRCETMWNTANNYYEYWIDPDPAPAEISPAQADRYTRHPPQTERLGQWLDGVLQGATQPFDVAQRIERHLQQNFKYKLGAPELRRLNPIEDFVFNQREGHCERFAATMALLLRMKGIPSRILVGYLPNSRSWVSGWHNVRFKDAHAWTEAYIPGRGWMQFDATPAATQQPDDLPFAELFDTIDFVWSSFVVNFDALSQKQLFRASLRFVTEASRWLEQQTWLLAPLAGVTLLFLFRRRRKTSAAGQTPEQRERREAQMLAEHYYGRMLRMLARHGHVRLPQQTPIEFLGILAARALPDVADAGRVTQTFCATRYGNNLLPPQEQSEVEAALRRLEQALNSNRRQPTASSNA